MGNRLGAETSPYLLQHADNPVHWQPWDEQALELARTSGKPILLSIGYSACHWCHVMAHESFEDAETAALMNSLFVNIKLDREERPDLDRIYQTVHQVLTQRPGGWPLTVFLTAQQHYPIFAGTYFPKEARYGMPSFSEILNRVAEVATQHEDEISERGVALTKALRSMHSTSDDFGTQLGAAPIAGAITRLASSFDADNGGFGDAPKFPHASSLEFLLERWHAAPESAQEREIVLQSLKGMSREGLYDQLGGGFFRYSVDRHWTIPHFEKMLYDNAALLGLYADAARAFDDPLFGQVASDTADWVIREMQAEGGGYFSTLNADSEGEEGKYYVWSRDEPVRVLEPAEIEVAQRVYGLDAPANFEGTHWHLSIGDRAQALTDQESKLLQSARDSLLNVRSERVRPSRDDKRLTSWNGLMIAGMARAARRLGRTDLADSASEAAQFIQTTLCKEGRLGASFKDGQARFPAFLDDHAFLALGLLELLQLRWRTPDLKFATSLLDALLADYRDPAGGFFFTPDDYEELLFRPKPLSDESIPSGNAVTVLCLQAFGHLLGNTEYLSAAEDTLKSAIAQLEQHPEAHPTMLRALSGALQPPRIIVVRAGKAELELWQEAVDTRYLPTTRAFFIPENEKALPGLLAARKPGADARAYVCEGMSCQAPVTSIEEFIALL